MKEIKNTPTAKTVLTATENPIDAVVKPRRKRYHKPKAKVVVETPAETITPSMPKQITKRPNWFKRQYNKFILWLSK